MSIPATLYWSGEADGHLRLIDQTLLPNALVEMECHDVPTVFEAIRSLRVRGAPAIGIAAAYGLCLAAQQATDASSLRTAVAAAAEHLATSRPTAVNLFWALERMRAWLDEQPADLTVDDLRSALLTEAQTIHDEDRRMCRAIGRRGAPLLAHVQGVLTHCNAGGLATSEYGTALAVIYTAHESGQSLHVYVDETRPLLQGARLTAWELQQHGIHATLICDSMAAHVMQAGRVQAVVVGADRIAANGDVANKIGTYGVALAAAAHGIPFYVAAPSSTFDLALASGQDIPIEQRAAEEITEPFGTRIAPTKINVYNPAFDVTPAEYIAAIICEQGVIQPVTAASIRALLTH
ncbi:MAG: S-methyl-5-thioribose-1-phosphate isomerase [Planctomycetales bacterium]|nr:S-methyl-5-thioribose-1-phosphate isomerase [Planctomycetales bacterium]